MATHGMPALKGIENLLLNKVARKPALRARALSTAIIHCTSVTYMK
jgi:hypothetical protein